MTGSGRPRTVGEPARQGPAAGRVRLRIGSRRELLEPVDGLSDRVFARAGFDEEERYWLVTAVHEAVSNALLHGNRERPGTHVELLYELSDEWVRVTVTDQGEGFDPKALPSPVARGNLLASKGRGIYLMRQLMDEVTFRFPRGGGTKLSLTKARGGASGRSGTS